MGMTFAIQTQFVISWDMVVCRASASDLSLSAVSSLIDIVFLLLFGFGFSKTSCSYKQLKYIYKQIITYSDQLILMGVFFHDE